MRLQLLVSHELSSQTCLQAFLVFRMSTPPRTELDSGYPSSNCRLSIQGPYRSLQAFCRRAVHPGTRCD